MEIGKVIGTLIVNSLIKKDVCPCREYSNKKEDKEACGYWES